LDETGVDRLLLQIRSSSGKRAGQMHAHRFGASLGGCPSRPALPVLSPAWGSLARPLVLTHLRSIRAVMIQKSFLPLNGIKGADGRLQHSQSQCTRLD